MKEVLLPLIGDVEILYYNTGEDLARFKALQSKLESNLASRQITTFIATEKVTDAWQVYHHMLSDGNFSFIRKNAGYLIMTLADAVAIYHHTYYHYGLKKQFADLQDMSGLPEQICNEYLRVIQSNITSDILLHCHAILSAVCEYMNLQIPTKQTANAQKVKMIMRRRRRPETKMRP